MARFTFFLIGLLAIAAGGGSRLLPASKCLQLRALSGCYDFYRRYVIIPENVKIAKEVVAFAGLGQRVEFLVGVLSNVTKDLKARAHNLDMVFLDHDKSFYLSDLKLLISEGFLKQGSVVIADNVLIPGAPDYLAFMEESKDFVTKKHETEVEYMKHLKDMVTVSIYQGAT
ncbi:catechol O-methyltransferase [Klebsormidium nitens]|uniref:catechol O-methyltransferase n=1 Tax=Klebsormidium nitens TaxID=105231 RepID=A0A1Y1IIL2_KLENI|nr:catechol O-methyltransferase [Klebsormidium nitens]|eukprot:GAQ90543.1 catechol O-methyltransferase [Klebsormidium nitens]